ncbi:MAG: hypothetical protein EPN39_19885 [Chitinophagaceae bacterium]|nr:MAG: hypothetical protein EPN39_19885 [Chitinophagaceae bacterium]
MHRIIISDTSCLIILAKINELDLSQKMYGKIHTTMDIAEEYGDSLPDWIIIIDVKDKTKQSASLLKQTKNVWLNRKAKEQNTQTANIVPGN